MIANHEYFEYFTLKNTVSSIFVQFLKMWYQNIQKNKYKQQKITKKIFEKFLVYFWVNFGVKNDQKNPKSLFFCFFTP